MMSCAVHCRTTPSLHSVDSWSFKRHHDLMANTFSALNDSQMSRTSHDSLCFYSVSLVYSLCVIAAVRLRVGVLQSNQLLSLKLGVIIAPTSGRTG